MTKVGDVWYRFEDGRYAAPPDEYGDSQGPGRFYVRLRRLNVAKVTPKGVRLLTGEFILDSSTKKFACPTIALAKTSFIKRKERQKEILKARLHNVNTALVAIYCDKYEDYDPGYEQVEYGLFTRP